LRSSCIAHVGREDEEETCATYRCERLRRRTCPRIELASMDVAVMMTKMVGMIQSSLSSSGVRLNATLEKSRQGVNRAMLTPFRCCDAVSVENAIINQFRKMGEPCWLVS